VLKQIIVGAVIYFVVASFVNKDKVSEPDATAIVAPILQSRSPGGNEKPTTTAMTAVSLHPLQ
jgi:hypothetical protein